MTKYIKIDSKIINNKNILEYLNPDYIYIPYYDNSKLNIKNDEIIHKNSIVLINNQDYYYSPVSGKVIGLCQNIVNNKESKTIVIENDFREKSNNITGYRKDWYKLSKNELIKKLNHYGLNIDFNDSKYLIINGIDNEPNELVNDFLLANYQEDLLDTIDALINILKIEKCLLCIKNNDSKIVEGLLNQIGTYPNIELRLLPDVYPIGNEIVLAKELKLTNYNYLTINTVYNIHHILKRNEPLTEKLVTITGNLINNPKVVKVKLGTRIGDLLQDELKDIKQYHIIINGLLSGYEVKTLNTIITRNTRSIFICKLNTPSKSECIKCGLCVKYCPVNCDPISKKNMDKCLKCGLCNYLCPSKITVVGEHNE